MGRKYTGAWLQEHECVGEERQGQIWDCDAVTNKRQHGAGDLSPGWPFRVALNSGLGLCVPVLMGGEQSPESGRFLQPREICVEEQDYELPAGNSLGCWKIHVSILKVMWGIF